MKNFYLLVLLLSLFAACSTTEKTEESSAPQGMMELDLSQYGNPMTIVVPDSTVGPLEVTAQSYGDIEIRVGQYFQIKIAPGGDLALRKSDLQADLLFKTTILTDEPNLIVYKSDLPDGSKSYFHFYMVAGTENGNYEISDISESAEPFNEGMVTKMLESAKTLKAKPKS